MQATPIAFAVDDRTVSGILITPRRPLACYVMAHGAGAGMTHPFMAAMAEGLAERGIASLRYQFPYMESGSARPDLPRLAHATVRAAVGTAAGLAPHLTLLAGGKSYGGRMTSQAQAASPLPGVRGLAFLGFPLHPAKQHGVSRAAHLDEVKIPMLFLQGDRDALADLALLTPIVRRLGASLEIIEMADHSFRVPARSGRSDAHAMTQMLDAFANWVSRLT